MANSRKRNIKPTLVAVAALLVLMAGSLTAYHYFRQSGQAGAKTIHVEIVIEDTTARALELHTDAPYLRQALEEQGLIQGEETIYGFMVTSVDGTTADGSKQEWWCLTKDGAFLNTGVDDTPIKDADTFELTLRVGYD